MDFKKNLLGIFYFPLVVFTFTLVLNSLMNLFFVEPVLNGEFIYGQNQAFFNGKNLKAPSFPFIAKNQQKSDVLAATAGEKWIDVNLSTQTLTAYEPDGKIFMQVPISSGLWAPTPTGSFRIWIKLRYTLMKGGSKEAGTYYYLPNVPCTQYFYKGYGLHGTYWHNNFGQPMSHGCINMSTPDACRLFEWTLPVIDPNFNMVKSSSQNPGTLVIIHF